MHEVSPQDSAAQKSEITLNAPLLIEVGYDSITPSTLEHMTTEAIALINATIEKMVLEPSPTFAGTLGILHEVDDVLSLTSSTLHAMANLHPDESVRTTASASSTELTNFATDLQYRDDVFELVRTFSDTDEAKTLSGEEALLLESTVRFYRRSGYELSSAERLEIAELKKLTAKKVREFQQNVGKDTTKIYFNPEQLTGVPTDCIEHLEALEDGTLVVNVAGPDYFAALRNADNRQTRYDLQLTYQTRLVDTNPALIEEVAALRHTTATMLGYASWADYQLEERMAKNPKTVQDFYQQILPALTQKAHQEIAVMTQMLHDDGYEGPLERYDMGYYETKIRQTEYNINTEEVSRYFPLPAVIEGLFETTSTVFGIRYRQIEDAPTWHPDVMTYAIDDAQTGEEIAQFYMDLYPREGKYKHAAAQSLVAGREMPDGSYRQPRSQIMTNFQAPFGDKPSLLTHGDVTTLFHEFGHLLHQTLTKARFVNFSGTKTERDFVEAPSQINENWTWEPAVLQSFARHYKTGEPMPPELIQNLIAARGLNTAVGQLSQVTLGKFDIALHSEPTGASVYELWQQACTALPVPLPKGSFQAATITHFMSGYDAGYYGYLWSKVYGDDMYSRFAAEGITNPEVGKEYRQKILEKGGTADAVDMVGDFLKRAPNSEAFARNLGIAALKPTATP